MGYWIFQANPVHYDIVAAVAVLDEIVWRVPQHTGDIRPGDCVAIWRSGKDAGMVGLGTVATTPALAEVPATELPFVLDGTSEGAAETRVVLRVVPISPVSKAHVSAMDAMAGHLILTAPMGTVFPVSDDQWATLAPAFDRAPPELPEVAAQPGEWPSPYSWNDRRKDAYPMPGGYDGYLQTLRQILDFVSRQRPSVDELTADLQERLGSSPANARHISLFVRRAGFVADVAGRLEVTPVAEEFLGTGNPGLVIAQLHQRVRFIGEMLDLLRTPHAPDELMKVASDRFGMNWKTKAQIQRRRGWMQSAGAIEVDSAGRLLLTKSGAAILSKLHLHTDQGDIDPVDASATPQAMAAADEEAEALVDLLNATSTDSQSPDNFEFAIRDAFAFLGFRAVKVGGSGKTDVVADADIGRDDSYRVIIDGKTTGRDAVSDSQIDWDTIDDHRKLHDADFVVVAAPVFGGARVVNRAADHRALLLTASDLGDMVRQHAASPLDLDAYRLLFSSPGGEADLEILTEAVETHDRFLDVAVAVMSQVEDHVSEVGSLSSRDLFLLLRGQSELDADEAEIEDALQALASPLIAMLTRSNDRYRPAGPRSTMLRRLELLSRRLAPAYPEESRS